MGSLIFSHHYIASSSPHHPLHCARHVCSRYPNEGLHRPRPPPLARRQRPHAPKRCLHGRLASGHNLRRIAHLLPSPQSTPLFPPFVPTNKTRKTVLISSFFPSPHTVSPLPSSSVTTLIALTPILHTSWGCGRLSSVRSF